MSLYRATLLPLLSLAFVAAAMAAPPNVLVVVVDDVGYSDLGAWGSEIRTPSIDALAADGLQLTNFHVAPNCSPTRAMLLSGTDHHLAGVGTMFESLWQTPEAEGREGYQGVLAERVAPLPALMREAGYRTFMAGKWHLGTVPDKRPHARGFDESFALLVGGASHFEDAAGLVSFQARAPYSENGELVEQLPEGFFSTAFYTDRMIGYIDKARAEGRPFFGYLAYSAPHWPLQVPEVWLDRYAGRYDAGWDVLREERLARMRELGLVSAGTEAFPRLEKVPAWSALTPTGRQIESRRMELFAAMVENLDHHLGRLVTHLRDTGMYDNTLIVFLSDNGPEGNHMTDIADNAYWVPANFDNRLQNMGRPGSYVWLGPGWAQIGALPQRLYKSFTSQGGIRVPAIIKGVGETARRGRGAAMTTVMDITPTLLDIAGKAHPGRRWQGRDVEPLRGRSMVDWLAGRREAVHAADAVFGWELFGRRAIRQGDWKILWLWAPYGPGRWQLYNLAEDPAERHDLAAQHPERLAALVREWERYARETGVIVLESDRGYGK